MSIEIAKGSYLGGGEFEPVRGSTLLEQVTNLLGADHSHIKRSHQLLERLEAEDDPLLVLGEMTRGYREQRRLNAWRDGDKENDVEHSYMLALVTSQVRSELYPDDSELDDLLVKDYAEVHDWIEILVGDTVTLAMSDAEYDNKTNGEDQAIDVLYNFLVRKGLTAQAATFLEYENQSTKTARFVKAVDKLMPSIHCLVGDAVGPHVEFGLTSTADLELALEANLSRFEKRFGAEFPELAEKLSEYQGKVTVVFRNVAGGEASAVNGVVGQRAIAASGSYEI